MSVPRVTTKNSDQALHRPVGDAGAGPGEYDLCEVRSNFAKLAASQPPPSALISRTLSTIRLPDTLDCSAFVGQGRALGRDHSEISRHPTRVAVFRKSE
jgi:hypothetical protein